MPIWLIFAATAVITCAVMVAFAVMAFTRGASNAALVGGLLGGLAIWQITPMVIRNRPRELPRGEIPPELLP